MFRSINLNPFSTPSDPKLAFRATLLPRLYAETIPLNDTEYWSTFCTVFDTAYDVANLLQAQDIAKALVSHPENVVALVRTLSAEVERILGDKAFPSVKKADGAGIAAYTPAFLARENVEAKKEDTTRLMLNCLRVLSRVVPCLLAHEDGLLEEEVFWKPSDSPDSSSSLPASSSQFVIDDDGEDDTSKSDSKAKHTNVKVNPVLAEKLLDIAVDLLFVHGFTLPLAPPQAMKSKVAYSIWENGIGSNTSVPVSRECDGNRAEVLRFLLVLMSKTLYIPSNALSGYGETQADNRWHAHFVKMPAEAKSRKRLLSLLCSLLNTSLKSGAYYASNAGGLVGAVGGVVGESYEKLVSGGKHREDPTRLALVKVAVQFLNVLLCIPTPESLQGLDLRSPPPTPSLNRNTSMVSILSQDSIGGQADSNAFVHYLSKLHRASDVGFIVENLLPILLQPMNTSLLKLPLEAVGVTATASPIMATDFLILLWSMLNTIPNFAETLLDKGKQSHSVMVVLLYFCLEYKDNPAQLGLVKLAAFLLQTLSAERAFGATLNEPLDNRLPLPSKYAIPGTAADFLVQHLYTLIFSTKGSLNAIYPAFVLTITNISPFLKNPSIKTSTRLTQLFLAMSTPTFLLSDEANPRLVYYILEALNNVIQHQLSDCPNLIYSLIRSHARFEELANFTVASGVASIKRAREQKSAKASLDDKTSARSSLAVERDANLTSDSGDKAVENDEKAALVERDRQQQDSPEEGQVTSPPPVSPILEYPPRQNQAGHILSEKAAGKRPMRSMSQLTLQSDASVDGSGFVARNGFVPTESWVASWREGLPIDPILILISECLPKVSSLSSLSTSTAVLSYLKGVTLVGLLPPSPPVKARRFGESMHSKIWLMSLAWGNVYVYSLEVPGGAFWRGTTIKLFNVKHSGETSGVQAAVSNLVGQGLGMLSLGARRGFSSPVDERPSFTRSRSRSSSTATRSTGGGVL